MTHLAIDYGTRKIWLAIEVEGIAFPLSIIPTKEVFTHLPKIVRERSIDTIVIGIANHMDGTVSEHATRTREFMKKLTNILPKTLKYVEWDERLTTFEARSSLGQIGTAHVRDAVDDVAASIFLQSYLESIRN
ncbi:MAG: hypothetical protein ACD_78C00371G0001 [uncultured bacterium (gcode 4)]|uniref:Putative pre-16S rRNA nuclease n=1 Tax=uncultured bacterium (gcode 4) TaxID=1234023 RepID=K1YAW6_9BACT|nr:MAG: hypothetical protein ACD_78C00371G0001 [uncultured bacterium (gcode 4)]